MGNFHSKLAGCCSANEEMEVGGRIRRGNDTPYSALREDEEATAFEAENIGGTTGVVSLRNEGNEGISAVKMLVKGDVTYDTYKFFPGENNTFTAPVIVGGTHAKFVIQQSEEQAKSDHVWKSLQACLQHEHENLQIPKMPWLGDWELKFDEYYVDLSIESKNDKEIKDVPLHQIFQSTERENSSRILIEAAPGYGKTTVACKLCYDHSKKKDYISQFEVVILLRLREFENTLDELITQTLDLKNYSAQHVLEVIDQNQSKVLFILDGLDELAPDKLDEIVPILKKKQFPHSTVIVTSRTGSMQLKNKEAEPALRNILHCMDIRIVIKGLTGEKRIEFLETYLHHSPDKLKYILSMAENKFESIFQEKLFGCPLFLLLLVIVAEEADISIHRTKTDIYKTLFNFILRRMLTTLGKDDQKCDFFDYDKSHPPAYVQSLSQFGCLAIRALHNRQYSFTAEEIRSHCGGEDIIKLGILTQNDSKIGLKRKSWFEPVHLSFLEFSAAYHISVNITNNECSNVHLLFYTRYALSAFQDISFEFLFTLCKKQLFDLCSKLRNVWRTDGWLTKFVKFGMELEAESQLNLPSLAAAMVFLVPTDFFLPSENYDLASNLLKETLALALHTNRLKRLVLRNQCNINRREKNSERLIIYPVKVERNSHQSDNAVKKIWREILTHQDLEIDESKRDFKSESENVVMKSDIGCTFELTICEASLDRQLKWLSTWLSVKGLLINKPIYKIKYKMPLMFDFAENLCKITNLVRREKVESIEIDIKPACIIALEPWADFISQAKQSKRLLDMQIKGCRETLFVDLSASDGKKWRKIKFAGKVVPCVKPPLVPSGGYHEWNIECVVNRIPGNIEYLHVEQEWAKYTFVQNSATPIVRHLHELLITVDEPQQLQQVWNWKHLGNLKLLTIGFFNSSKLNDVVLSSLLSLIFRSHPRMKLEFWFNCSDEVIHNFLLKMNEVKWPQQRTQEEKTSRKLDTLVLSPSMLCHPLVLSPSILNGVVFSERTIKLMKQLLLSGQLGRIWVSGDRYWKEYSTPELLEQFSVTEGFKCFVRVRSEEDTHSWPESSFHAEYYIEIRVQKRKNT